MAPERQFTAIEVIDILKACRDTGVTEFEGGGFRVLLGRPAQKSPWELPEIAPAPVPPAPTMAEPDHEAQTQAALEIDELKMREDQIAEMLIVDPLAAEEMIAKGDLVDNGDERSE